MLLAQPWMRVGPTGRSHRRSGPLGGEETGRHGHDDETEDRGDGDGVPEHRRGQDHADQPQADASDDP